MTASYRAQFPAIRFQLLDELFAIYGGYYVYFLESINTVTTTDRALLVRLDSNVLECALSGTQFAALAMAGISKRLKPEIT